MISSLSRIYAFLKPAGCVKVDLEHGLVDTDCPMSLGHGSGANWREYFLFERVSDDTTEWYPGCFDDEPVDPGMMSTDEDDQMNTPDPIRFVYEKKRIGPQQSIYVMADVKFLARILWYRSSKKIMDGQLHGDVSLPDVTLKATEQVFSIEYLLKNVFPQHGMPMGTAFDRTLATRPRHNEHGSRQTSRDSGVQQRNDEGNVGEDCRLWLAEAG